MNMNYLLVPINSIMISGLLSLPYDYLYNSYPFTNFKHDNKMLFYYCFNVFQHMLSFFIAYNSKLYLNTFADENDNFIESTVYPILTIDIIMFIIHKYILHGPLISLHKVHHSKISNKNLWFMDLYYIHPIDNLITFCFPTIVGFLPFKISENYLLKLTTGMICANMYVHSSMYQGSHSKHHMWCDESYSIGMFIDELYLIYTKKYCNLSKLITKLVGLYIIFVYNEHITMYSIITMICIINFIIIGKFYINKMIFKDDNSYRNDSFIITFMEKTNLWRLFYDELGKLNFLKTMNWGYSINNDINKISTYEMPKNYSKSDINSLNLYYYLVETAINYSKIQVKMNADIGCGKGGGVSFINKCFKYDKSIGYDFSTESLNQAKIDYFDEKIEFKYFDARKLQYCEPVDLITNVESFHCYGYKSKFFENCYNMLNENGILAMTDFIDIKLIQKLRKEASEYFNLLYLEDISPNVIMSVDQKNRMNDVEIGTKKIKEKFPYMPEFILNAIVPHFIGEKNSINMKNNKTMYFLAIFIKLPVPEVRYDPNKFKCIEHFLQ